jgi:CheY-like chemotaxis protein
MRLLIVDDEPSVLQYMKAMLEPLAEEIVTVEDSARAAEYLEGQKFDGVILDVRMPSLDGFELTRRARSSTLNSKSPIALLTGYDDAGTMVQGFKAGATCFLGKPLTREKIQSLVSFMRGPVMTERRRNARLPFRCKVNCTAGPLRQTRFVADSINIGEGGMMLSGSGGLEVGSAVCLEFGVPTSEKPLRMKGTVLRRESDDRIAVQFLDSTIRDREAIQYFILHMLQQ